MQGYSIPETTRAYGAVLLNADGEEFTDSLGPRDAVEPGDRRGGREGQGRRDAGRPARRLPRHDADPARATPSVSLPYMLRRYRAARDRPAARADLHVSRPPLPERRPRDRRERRDDARGALRLRRDRRRDARAQPDDGQLACSSAASSAAARAGPPRRKRGHEHASTPISQRAVEDAAAHLYVWALKDIPQDLRDALADAADARDVGPGQRVLETILKQRRGRGRREKNLVCQDTGIAVYTCRVGEHFPLHPARIYAALQDRHRARDASSIRCARTRCTRSRARTPGRTPATGCRSSTGSSSPTGTGSTSSASRRAPARENMSFLKMCVPADGVKGDQAVRARVDRRRRRQAVPARHRRRRHRRLARTTRCISPRRRSRARSARATPTRIVAQLEDELYELLNETGIGPMGLGGDVTVLSVPHRARGHAHDAEPRRGQLPVLGRASRERARRGRRRRRVRPEA